MKNIVEFNYRVLSEDFMENRYSVVKYFNFINNRDLDGNIIRNSKYDSYGNPWRVSVQDIVADYKHNLIFNNKFEMLNFLVMLMNNNSLQIMSYSSIKETNIDKNSIID